MKHVILRHFTKSSSIRLYRLGQIIQIGSDYTDWSNISYVREPFDCIKVLTSRIHSWGTVQPQGESSALSMALLQSLILSKHENANDPKALDQLMSSIDDNNDGELTFSEFWQLIGKLASKQGGMN
uniref:EF-hand domain-containing protein n=1 Tax=Fundulus heteroclitus TaxID=8078 RepID=A0A3Q2QKK0_FUNHE